MPCQTPHLDEATTAAPDVSPGPVKDKEILLREMLNPDHVVEGEVRSAAVSLRDLREQGFSVNRMDHVTRHFVERALNQRLGRPFQGMPRASEGVAQFTARAVRELTDNGKQVFVVIDTATESNKGHASVYLSDVRVSDSLARGMRNQLLPLLENRISVAEAFAGR